MKKLDMAGFDTITEEGLAPVLKLLQGGDADEIAGKAGITRQELLKMRDELLADVYPREDEKPDASGGRIGRNEPCPCGSGKKYKHCCLLKQEADRPVQAHTEKQTEAGAARERQENFITLIDEAFSLMAKGRYVESVRFASDLLCKYPNEDRLHDIAATANIYRGEFDAAVRICRKRLKAAESEKAYFIEHGRYRDADADAETDRPALSYYYPPLTWRQKYWAALKAKDYHIGYPAEPDMKLVSLVQSLRTADDAALFPEKHARGLELRKNALAGTLAELKGTGPESIPYLLPLACRYSWTGLFVPEILAAFDTDNAVEGLIDISMFGFAYASGASLHYLEKKGGRIIPYIEAAFSRHKAFDPIKTGIVSVLGNIQGDRAYDLLMRLLEHESHHIVNWAGGALGKFRNTGALPAMVAANERIGKEKMIDKAIRQLMDLL